MGIGRQFGVGPITIHTDEMGSAVVLGGLNRWMVNTGTTIRSEAHSGEVYPEFQALVSQRIGATFETMRIAEALGAIPAAGRAITSSSNAGLQLVLAKHAQGSTRSSSSDHPRYTIGEGLIVPRVLSCEHQGDARLTAEAMATYDGVNAPILRDDAALPDADDDERFTIGPVTIAGIDLEQVRSVSLDFGVNATSEGADSDVWDTFASVRSIEPVLTISTVAPDDFSEATGKVPLLGLNGTHATSSVYFRKRSKGGTFVGDGETEHIRAQVSGILHVEEVGADGGGLGEIRYTMPLRFDSSNAPIVLALATAIT